MLSAGFAATEIEQYRTFLCFSLSGKNSIVSFIELCLRCSSYAPITAFINQKRAVLAVNFLALVCRYIRFWKLVVDLDLSYGIEVCLLLSITATIWLRVLSLYESATNGKEFPVYFNSDPIRIDILVHEGQAGS